MAPLGDAILAVFGAPNYLPDHAERAVRCALGMRQRLVELNQEWRQSGLSQYWQDGGEAGLSERIGMHTGAVVAGNLGGNTRGKYSVIGDSVNVAARLEAMNKELVQWIANVNQETGNTAMAKLLVDIQDYHMDVSEVGALAQEANVQRLALNHLAPQPRGRLQAKRFFRDPIAELYSGELYVGEDGMQIAIPVP